MRTNSKKNHLIFIDIETVANFPCYELLSKDMKKLWDIKAKFLSLSANNQTRTACSLYRAKAGIYSEFSKVVCISIAEYYELEELGTWKSYSFYGKDELKLLANFTEFLESNCPKMNRIKIIGHNIREFDIPFLIRRMLINGVILPKVLEIRGRKPWQIEHLVDTMNLWKFGDFKNYTSLNLLANILNVPSSKESLDGSKVHDTYWLDQDLEGIKTYCEKDVKTTSQVYFKLIQKPFPQCLISANKLL